VPRPAPAAAPGAAGNRGQSRLAGCCDGLGPTTARRWRRVPHLIHRCVRASDRVSRRVVLACVRGLSAPSRAEVGPTEGPADIVGSQIPTVSRLRPIVPTAPRGSPRVAGDAVPGVDKPLLSRPSVGKRRLNHTYSSSRQHSRCGGVGRLGPPPIPRRLRQPLWGSSMV
jgi:hypothetical protein